MESSRELEKGDGESSLGGILDVLIGRCMGIFFQDAHESFKY